MVGANIDVTDRKQTAQDLAEPTVQLALAERAARVGSYAYDLDREIMHFSPMNSAAQLGYCSHPKASAAGWKFPANGWHR